MKKINLVDVKAAMFDLSFELEETMELSSYSVSDEIILELNSQVYSDEDSSYSILVSYNNKEEQVVDVTLYHKYRSTLDVGELTYDNKELCSLLFKRLKNLFDVDTIGFKAKLG